MIRNIPHAWFTARDISMRSTSRAAWTPNRRDESIHMTSENLFWREADEPEKSFKVSDEIYDLVFSLRGSKLAIDHAFALAEALESHLGAETCARIGVHGVHMAGSGNGWTRPQQSDTEMPLSRRARLAIRLHREDHEAVAGISDQTLQLGRQQLQVGASSTRRLSSMANLYARAVCCDPDQSEPEFLAQVAVDLQRLDIKVTRMICGRSGEIRSNRGNLFTRTLLVADLKPDASVRLQQQGLGEARLLGCGLFVPHRGIDAVYTAQE
jgi:CRISPR-associated protein Cas6